MRNFPFFILSFFFLLFSLTIRGEEIPSYTWKECLDLAIRNNPELASSLSKIKASQYGQRATRSGYMPQIYASLGKEKKTTTIDSLKTKSDSYSLSLNASYNLFNGLKDYNLLSQAEIEVEIQKAEYIETSADILYELKSAFEDYRYAKNYKILIEKILKRRRENLRLVNLRFEGGLENKGSELLSQGNLVQAQYDLLQAEQSLETSQSTLAKTLGLNADTPLDIEGELLSLPPPKKRPDFESLARTTPAYAKALSQEKYYKKSISIARAAFSPSLDLRGSLTQAGQKIGDNDSQSKSASLSLSIPLFDGTSDYYKVKQASANYASQKAIRINTQRKISIDLREKYMNFLLAEKQLEMNTILKEAAEVRAKIARGKYNNGLLSFEDWILIEDDLISKQKSYLTGRKNRILAEASWYQALGKGITQ